jgi:hypothetical protein
MRISDAGGIPAASPARSALPWYVGQSRVVPGGADAVADAVAVAVGAGVPVVGVAGDPLAEQAAAASPTSTTATARLLILARMPPSSPTARTPGTA